MTDSPRRPTARNIRVTDDAHTAVSRLAYALTGAAGRRVSQSDAIVAACVVASANLPAAVAALPDGGQDAP